MITVILKFIKKKLNKSLMQNGSLILNATNLPFIQSFYIGKEIHFL